MDDFGYAQMHQMIADGMMAYDYAWLHYEEFANRAAAYQLYGPACHTVGILAAGFVGCGEDRKIQAKKPRRKRYLVYEFDQDHRLLRIQHIQNYDQIECTCHFFFSYDDILRVCLFRGNEKKFYAHEIYSIDVQNGRTRSIAVTRPNYLCVDFYAYPADDRVQTTRYLYLPASIYCATGLKASWAAPFNAQNSPVTMDFREEAYHHIDFVEHFLR